MSRSLTRTLAVIVVGLVVSVAGALSAQQAPPAAPAPRLVNASPDPLLQGFKFRAIGPAVMMGRVDDIEGAEKDPMILYAGFATGGVWKSTDGGNHWLSLFDEVTATSIGDIAIAPSDPNVVYVGTGEPNNRQSSSIGAGVFKTTDGGKTWAHVGLEDTQSIGRIVVHPVDPNIVYVAAVGHLFGSNPERGLYKSIDGGKTWKLAKFIDNDTGFIDVAIDPVNPKILYAASFQRRRTWWGTNGGGAGSGLWKTMDAGETWTKITGGGFPTPKDGILGRIGISVFRAKPTTLYIIAEVGAEGGISVNVGDDGLAPKPGTPCCGDAGSRNGPDRSGVWRSDDGGKTWTFLSNVNNRPIYYSQIRVDPVNDKKVFQGGASAQMSFDGGKTWNGLSGTGHGDYHAFWINPKDPRIVAVGHDGGIDISNDGGFTWDYHNDMALGQFYQVSADMRRPYVVCGGLQDNQAWCGPSMVRSGNGPVNTDWFTIAGGDGFYTRQDPTDWTIAYGESQNAAMQRYDFRHGTQKSITPRIGAPGGAAPAGRGGGQGNVLNPPSNAQPLRFYWNTPFELSPHDPATVYIAGQYFFRSKDRGDTWTMNATNLTQSFDRFGPANAIMGVGGDKPMASKHDGYGENSVSTQLRESPSKPGVIWIGTDDGNLHVSQDGGATFTNVFNNMPGVAGMKSAGTGAPHVQVSRIEPSHFDAATAYVALDNHRNDDWAPYLFKTTDYGKTWTNVTGNLPAKGNINALREDPVNPALLFVGTEFNLFASLDGAKTWKLFSTGLPSVRVDDILIHPRDKDLIVGTHGRSIWIMDDITPLEQMASTTGTSVKLFDPRPAVQWKTDLQATRRATARQFKGENPAPGTALSFWSPSDMGEAKFEILSAQGQVVSTLTTTAKAGMNRLQWNMQATAAGGPGGRAGAPGFGPGGPGGRGGAPPSHLTAEEMAAGQAAFEKARASAAVTGGAGGQTPVGPRGGGGGGGRGGFGGNLVPPGSYLVRLTVGGQTMTTSVLVVEDIWMNK